jgi:hypothetical protein
MKAYKALVKFALSTGHVVSVNDGGDWPVKRSTGYKAIIDAIESVEEAALVIRDANDVKVAWVLVQPFGLEDDETIVDNTMTPFMDTFDMLYAMKL